MGMNSEPELLYYYKKYHDKNSCFGDYVVKSIIFIHYLQIILIIRLIRINIKGNR